MISDWLLFNETSRIENGKAKANPIAYDCPSLSTIIIVIVINIDINIDIVIGIIIVIVIVISIGISIGIVIVMISFVRHDNINE